MTHIEINFLNNRRYNNYIKVLLTKKTESFSRIEFEKFMAKDRVLSHIKNNSEYKLLEHRDVEVTITNYSPGKCNMAQTTYMV